MVSMTSLLPIFHFSLDLALRNTQHYYTTQVHGMQYHNARTIDVTAFEQYVDVSILALGPRSCKPKQPIPCSIVARLARLSLNTHHRRARLRASEGCCRNGPMSFCSHCLVAATSDRLQRNEGFASHYCHLHGLLVNCVSRSSQDSEQRPTLPTSEVDSEVTLCPREAAAAFSPPFLSLRLTRKRPSASPFAAPKRHVKKASSLYPILAPRCDPLFPLQS